ncbi:hypothetical protein QL996_13565 [Planococcus sp. APC 4015]|nr:hypothetical protein [Planococcus sp. APC 4015]
MREAIEELMREVSTRWSTDRAARAARMPRSRRPHRARSTFLEPTREIVPRRLAA